MNIFVVFHVTDSEKTGIALRERFPEDYYELGGSQWLVAAAKTAREIAEALEFGTDNIGIVFSMANYWGHAAPDVWEWIKVKAELKRAG